MDQLDADSCEPKGEVEVGGACGRAPPLEWEGEEGEGVGAMPGACHCTSPSPTAVPARVRKGVCTRG